MHRLFATFTLFVATFPLCAAGAAAAVGAAAPNVEAYDEVLQSYVLSNGKVRYLSLRANLGPLEQFVEQIGVVSPQSHADLFRTREEKLAYWINAYNSLVLWAFAQDYPEKKNRLGGLIGRGLFFYQRKFLVGGEKRSLASIENDIIRKQFGDPRIHFALVCASSGCPWLAQRAYTGENLEQMLEMETIRFLRRESNVRIDRAKRVVTLSKLFDWYEKDFGQSPEEILAFVARHRDDADDLQQGEWKIRYFDYDWSPNDAPERAN